MITHKEIWQGIDRLADSFGYSPSGLAKKAGLDSTSFNISKRISPQGKPRWPTMESIAKILTVTGATMTEFIDLMGPNTESKKAKGKAAKMIPVIGFAQAGRKGFFDEDGFPAGNGWDEIKLPGIKDADNHSYALKISGSSMEPLYRPGDIIIVSPGASVRRGDRVVVRTKSGEVMAKEVIKNTSKIELRSLNPMHENVALNPNQISWMARILWVSQ